jgi:hypothetical protein
MKLVGIDFQVPTSFFVMWPPEIRTVRGFRYELTEGESEPHASRLSSVISRRCTPGGMMQHPFLHPAAAPSGPT